MDTQKKIKTIKSNRGTTICVRMQENLSKIRKALQTRSGIAQRTVSAKHRLSKQDQNDAARKSI